MASSRLTSDISAEKLSNDFLTCPLCFDLYKSPKVLQCQHTFCLSCLRLYVASRGFASTFPCPVCKDVTLVPQNDVSKLKNNYTIVNLLQCVEESCKIAAGDEEKSALNTELASGDDCVSVCGACNETKPLGRYCENCEFWLCPTCTTSHKRIPATSNHILQTSQEMDGNCKKIAAEGETFVGELKQINDEKTELILSQIEQLPTMMDEVRHKIEKASDDVCSLVHEKRNELLRHLESFQSNQHDTFSRKLQSLENQNQEISRILNILNDIRISKDGYQNHKKATAIDKDVKNIPPLENFPANTSDFLSLSFRPYVNEKSELQHFHIGSLRIVKRFPDQPLSLQDHQLQMHKTATLDEREYITGLAVNKFAEKFVVANNESVYMLSPSCPQAKRFVPFQRYRHLKKPWGIAYCEAGKRVYITVAGEYEGEGAVYAYTSDGAEHTILASGLTLPRGIALHKGLIYVCDQIDRCVYILNSDGSIIKLLKKLPDGNFLFTQPMFVSVGANGRLAVSDASESVKIFDNEFNLIFTYSPNVPDVELWNVLVLHDGTTVVCDWKHGLHKISRDFQSNGLIAIEGNKLREPSALSSLENGNVIYIGNGMGEICSVI